MLSVLTIRDLSEALCWKTALVLIRCTLVRNTSFLCCITQTRRNSSCSPRHHARQDRNTIDCNLACSPRYADCGHSLLVLVKYGSSNTTQSGFIFLIVTSVPSLLYDRKLSPQSAF